MDGIDNTTQFVGRVPQWNIRGVSAEAPHHCGETRTSWRGFSSLLFTTAALIGSGDTAADAARGVRNTIQ